MKCSERGKRREASSTRSSLLALFALFISAFLCLAIIGCAGPIVGSVGAMLGKDVHSGRLFVREVPAGLAAAEAGVREGDEVIAVDGVPVAELSPAEVHQRLEGVVGTKVVLLIVRSGETRRVEVVRGPLLRP